MKMAKGFKHGATSKGMSALKGKSKGKTIIATPSNVKALGSKSGK
jgi:hypothetical protein